MSVTSEDVKEYFERVGKAVENLRYINLRRSSVYDSSLRSLSICANIQSGPGDKTGNLATTIVDNGMDFDAEEKALLTIVEDGHAVCRGVMRGLGVAYGLVLEYRYFWGLPWKQIATVMDMSRASVSKKRSVAFDWIAQVGWARAKEGVGTAEE